MPYGVSPSASGEISRAKNHGNLFTSSAVSVLTSLKDGSTSSVGVQALHVAHSSVANSTYSAVRAISALKNGCARARKATA